MRRKTDKSHLSAWNWPTQAEMREFNAAAYADTMLQILRGHGIYYGDEGHPDNDVPMPSATLIEQAERYDALREVKKQVKKQRLQIIRTRYKMDKETAVVQRNMRKAIEMTARFLKVDKQQAYEIIRKNGGV